MTSSNHSDGLSFFGCFENWYQRRSLNSPPLARRSSHRPYAPSAQFPSSGTSVMPRIWMSELRASESIGCTRPLKISGRLANSETANVLSALFRNKAESISAVNRIRMNHATQARQPADLGGGVSVSV